MIGPSKYQALERLKQEGFKEQSVTQERHFFSILSDVKLSL
jgi:hypothetical protein